MKEFYNLIYQYENDCLVAAIEYNKDYYSDRDLKPTEELFLSITIVPFASIGSPKIAK
jgi:LPS-assembly protein